RQSSPARSTPRIVTAHGPKARASLASSGPGNHVGGAGNRARRGFVRPIFSGPIGFVSRCSRCPRSEDGGDSHTKAYLGRWPAPRSPELRVQPPACPAAVATCSLAPTPSISPHIVSEVELDLLIRPARLRGRCLELAPIYRAPVEKRSSSLRKD